MMGMMTEKVRADSGGAEGIWRNRGGACSKKAGLVMLADIQIDKAHEHAAALGANARNAVELELRNLDQCSCGRCRPRQRFARCTTLFQRRRHSEHGVGSMRSMLEAGTGTD